jgi:hypothetical protein
MDALDQAKVTAEYKAHLNRWVDGKEGFIPPAEFLAQKVVARMVDKWLAEQGWLAA